MRTATNTGEPMVDEVAHDAIRAGDMVTLRRWAPAGFWGVREPAQLAIVGPHRVKSITRVSDWVVDGRSEPSWCLELDHPDSAIRGVWAVGKVYGGMVTTLERHS